MSGYTNFRITRTPSYELEKCKIFEHFLPVLMDVNSDEFCP